MFVDAFKEHAHIDFLFFIPPKSKLTKETLTEYVNRFWSVPSFDIYFETRDREPGDRHLVKDYLLPILKASYQQRFSGCVSERHLEALGRSLENNPDRIFAHKLGTMCLLRKIKRKLPPIYFDMDDIEHIYLRRSIAQPPFWRAKYLRYLNIPALKYAEKKACLLAERTFICSQADKEYLNRLYRTSRVTVIENGVPIPSIGKLRSSKKGHLVVYVGTYGYTPNVNAAEDLIFKIFPVIRQSIPEARLLIVGKGPENIQGFSSAPAGVEFTGFVESLDEIYQQADIVCCPITCGAGTRIKIIEAASFNKPVISTKLGAEGLKFIDKEEIIIRDNPEDIALQCVALLEDTAKRKRIGRAARSKVKYLYSEDAIQKKIRKFMCISSDLI
ncbi:MAG: glycosyltransferase family 4 protein [Alcanivoracaceae bacterium]|nr:glycosyltransferase family 4 protein [Alcanivoracaceae bacterium]